MKAFANTPRSFFAVTRPQSSFLHDIIGPMKSNELRERLLKIGVIEHAPVLLRSGKTAEYYCDIKKAFGYPDLLQALAQATAALIPQEVTCIAASGYGGIPLATQVSALLGKKLTLVREKEKDHGRSGRIDGYMPDKHDRIAVVDDVFTTGSSIRNTLEGLRITAGAVLLAVVVIRRGDTAQFPVPVSSVFDISELL